MIVKFIREKEGRNLSKSAYKILEIFESQDVTSAKELTSHLDFSTRAIHYSLQRLVERKILDRKPYLNDMRQTRYTLSEIIQTQFKNSCLKYR